MLIQSQQQLKRERNLFNLSDVASMAGVTIQTVCYHIGKGRLAVPSTTISGVMRYYTEDEAAQIRKFFSDRKKMKSANA